MKTLTTLLLTFLLLPCVVASERYEGPIIDMHMHAQNDIWSKRQLCFPEPCENRPATIAQNGAEVFEMTIAAMNDYKIVLGYLSGDADVVANWVEQAPGRFIASPIIDNPPEIDMAELRAAYERGEYSGMGEIATQYRGYAPGDPEVMPFFDIAAEFDVPAQVHTLGNGARMPSFRVAKGDPRLLEPVIVRHPDLRIFNENCGVPFTEAQTAMMYQYANLYCDLSTLLHLMPREAAMRHFRELVENGLAHRIMYGSDQMIWPETIGVVIEAIQTAPFLTHEQKADILYNNAARFLRLTDEEIAAHEAAAGRH